MNHGQTKRNVPLRWSQLLDSFVPAFLTISSPSKNQSRTRQKSDRFRDGEFFNNYPTTTYTFNILKRSDFSPLVARALRKLPGPPPQRLRVSAVKTPGNKLAKIYCTKSNKTEQNRTLFQSTSISATLSQRLTTTCRPLVRFFTRCR